LASSSRSANGKTVAGLQPILALDTATREGDRLVGPFSALWYLAFVVPLFMLTPTARPRPGAASWRTPGSPSSQAWSGSRREHTQIALFLAARMLYADGLGAVFSGIYASTVFGWGATELGLFGLVLIVAGVRRGARRRARRFARLEIGHRSDAGSVYRRVDRRALGR
jgi:UMF1 family MFS transporter